MTNNEKNKEEKLETSMEEKIKAMAKALIVSFAWSGAGLLDKAPVQDSQEEEQGKLTNTSEDKLKD